MTALRRYRGTRRITATTLLLGLLTATSGCGNSASGPAPATTAPTGAATTATPTGTATAAVAPTGESITLYNAQHRQTTAALVAAFTKATGIAVREVDKDDGELTAQLEEEGAASPADVFYSENTPFLQALDDRKMLAAVDPATLAAVPPGDSAPDRTWVGVSRRISTLIYDPARIAVDQLPKSVLDLALPQYKGKFEIAPGETDFEPVVASVAAAQGEEKTLAWLKAIKDNAGAKGSVPDYDTLTSDVAQGNTAFALINHYYYYRLKETVANGVAGAQLAYFQPNDPGYIDAVSGAAVLSSSKHQAAAQRFLAFLTSQIGQTILESGYSFEYPLRSDVAVNPALPPLSTYRTNAFDAAHLGNSEQVQSLLTKSGLI